MRKPYLDNLRYGIVLSVIIYHVCYLFNTVGITTNVAIPGIPALDVVEYLLYPWFMTALFVISGICARYSLERKTTGAFIRSRVRRHLIPSFAIIFLYGWTVGWVTGQYTDLWGGAEVPFGIKCIIYCLMGIGVLWYLQELLLAEAILLLIRKLDKKERLLALGAKSSMPVLYLLMFALWGSAQILNTPVVECYRNGIYIFSFLVGYYVFSHDSVQEMLSKAVPVLLPLAAVLAAVYTITAWGDNYTAPAHLKAFLTNAYAWFATIAVLGCGKRWLDRETGFTRYMAKRSFGFYVLHYPLMVFAAYGMDQHLHLPVWSMYLLLPVLMALLLPPLVAVIKRIPVLRTLILGEP